MQKMNTHTSRFAICLVLIETATLATCPKIFTRSRVCQRRTLGGWRWWEPGTKCIAAMASVEPSNSDVDFVVSFRQDASFRAPVILWLALVRRNSFPSPYVGHKVGHKTV